MLIKDEGIPVGILDIVHTFVATLKNKPEVVGVVLLGGVGKRQQFDLYSDIDVAVFIQSDIVPAWLPGFEFWVHLHKAIRGVKKLNFNVHQQSIIAERTHVWNEVKKEAYVNGSIIFDRNGSVAELIKSKTQWEQQAHKDALVRVMAKLPPYIFINPLKQARRGLFQVAHHLLNQGVDLIVEALFLINHQFLPHDKWKVDRSFSLPWLPKNYKRLLTAAMLIKSHNLKDIKRRVLLFEKVVDPLMQKAQESYFGVDFDFYDFACKNLLGRQLIDNPFAVIATKKLQNYCSSVDLERINGFINYYLIQSWSELQSFLRDESTFLVVGEKECRKILSVLITDNIL